MRTALPAKILRQRINSKLRLRQTAENISSARRTPIKLFTAHCRRRTWQVRRQSPRCPSFCRCPGGDPGLPPADQFLSGTGGTGLSVPSPFVGPDTRITNVNNLPPGPFQMTGPTMPYDAFTGDTIHQLFQMYQQVDCDGNRATRATLPAAGGRGKLRLREPASFPPNAGTGQ